MYRLVSCLEQHFKPGNSALCMFKAGEFFKSSSLGSIPKAGAIRTEEQRIALILAYADSAYFCGGAHTRHHPNGQTILGEEYTGAVNTSIDNSINTSSSCDALFGSYIFYKYSRPPRPGNEDVVARVLNSALLRNDIDMKWVACLKCLGEVLLSREALSGKYSAIELFLALHCRETEGEHSHGAEEGDDDVVNAAIDMVGKLQAVISSRSAAAQRTWSSKTAVTLEGTRVIRSLLLAIRHLLVPLGALRVEHFCLHSDADYAADPDSKDVTAAAILVKGNGRFRQLRVLVKELRELEAVLGVLVDSVSGDAATATATATSTATDSMRVHTFFQNTSFACEELCSWLGRANTFMLTVPRPVPLPGVIDLTQEVVDFCRLKPVMSCMRRTWSSSFADSNNGYPCGITATVAPGGKADALLLRVAGSADITALYQALFCDEETFVPADDLLERLNRERGLWTWKEDTCSGGSGRVKKKPKHAAISDQQREKELREREREQLACRLVTSLGELERCGVISILGVKGKETVHKNMHAGGTNWLQVPLSSSLSSTKP